MECRRVVVVDVVGVGRDGTDDVVDALVCMLLMPSKGLFCGNLPPRRKEDRT